MSNIDNLSNNWTLLWDDLSTIIMSTNVMIQNLTIYSNNNSKNNVKVKFTLDNDIVAFKESNSQEWTGETDSLGEIQVEIYSINEEACHFHLTASLVDHPEKTVEPLSLEFLPSNWALQWKNSPKTAVAPQEMTQNITVLLNDALQNSVKVKFTLQDSTGVAFKENGAQEWTGETDSLGEIQVEIYSINEEACHFHLTASLVDYPKITAEPLSLEFIRHSDNSIQLTSHFSKAYTTYISGKKRFYPYIEVKLEDYKITAILVDISGNPVKGETVKLSWGQSWGHNSDTGDGSVTSTVTVSNNIRSLFPHSLSVTAEVKGTDVKNTIDVTFSNRAFEDSGVIDYWTQSQ
ncbi:hypothetical protein [Xenorhabdus indica]|uniref:hypothetical protein n=1 Tax=Xenorhabdus indica TaxID=333964 RepID=UPI0016575A1C|nr:hypothetical protein [Xenorhabdus indica]MBC8947236.1 hypothetical protein [Xenorhabdus indica]